MSRDLILTLITGAIGGGLVRPALEFITAKREGRQSAKVENRRISLTEFEILHDRCLREVTRLSVKVRDLELMVVALSEEVARLGGDPLAIRIQAALHEHHIPHDEENSDDG